jgi:hypothetical protein
MIWIVLCEIIMPSNKHLKQGFSIKNLMTLMYIAKKLYNLYGNVVIFHELWIFGWKHTKDEPLLFKKWIFVYYITSIIVDIKLKSWWHPLVILNTNLKTLKFAQQHFWPQSSFWFKINFDPMVKWGGLDKNQCT